MHATFAVSLTAMTLYRGAEVYWMHQKVQYSTFQAVKSDKMVCQIFTHFIITKKKSLLFEADQLTASPLPHAGHLVLD